MQVHIKPYTIEDHLKSLSLHRSIEIYIDEAEDEAKAKHFYQDYLLRLLEAQLINKTERSVNRKMQIDAFSHLKRMEEFDFSYRPKINEKLIRELASLDFMQSAKNILFIGLPGFGETHLAISIGLKAFQTGKRVLFYSAERLTDELAAAEVSGMLNKKLDTLLRIDLLIIDE